MLLTNKLNKIKKLLDNDSVLTTIEERYCYATDATNSKIESKIPDLVVFVKTVDEIQNLMRYANKYKIPVIPRGAGTNMVGACTCKTGGIVLNFSKMNKILNINPINMTAKVQPGVILGDLKRAVDELNLFYPPDPSNYNVSTVGGSIAQSSGGARAFKYGTTKDYILSLKIVTADGNLMTIGAETIKDSVGYHLTQLFVGSEGTLGVIVEATLKLIPKPEATSVITAYYNTIETAIDSVNAIISNHHFPSTIDFMDKNSIKTVENFANCGLKSEYDSLLIIELDGYKNSIEEQAKKISFLLEKNSAKEVFVATNNEEIKRIWDARGASYSASTQLAPDVISDDIIVPRENLIEMIRACREITKNHGLKMCMVGHVGDGNLHPQIALDLENESEFRNLIDAKARIYKKAIELNGTISAEHGIGNDKMPYFEKVIDSNALNYMRFIKKSFDPNNILNPNKIFI